MPCLQVTTSMGRWLLEDAPVYNAFTGMTNNQCESFNATLKSLQKWSEVPVDTILLALYHLQTFYYNESQRGFTGKINI